MSIQELGTQIVENPLFHGMPSIWTGTGENLLINNLVTSLVDCYVRVFRSWDDPTSRNPDSFQVHAAKRMYLEEQDTFGSNMLVSLMLGETHDENSSPFVYGFAITDKFPRSYMSSIPAITKSICHVYPNITEQSPIISEYLMKKVKLGEMSEKQLIFYDLGSDTLSLRNHIGRLNFPRPISKAYYRAYSLSFMRTHLRQFENCDEDENIMFWTTQKSPLLRIATQREKFKRILTLLPRNEVNNDRPNINIFEIKTRDLIQILSSLSIYNQSRTNRDNNLISPIYY